MYVCMYVPGMYVCMYVCMYVLVCMYQVCMYVCMYAMYVRMYVCNVCMYVCMHVCMDMSMYVCMYNDVRKNGKRRNPASRVISKDIIIVRVYAHQFSYSYSDMLVCPLFRLGPTVRSVPACWYLVPGTTCIFMTRSTVVYRYSVG